jgi:hypothetical protein
VTTALTLLGFLISLPLAVYLWSAVFGLIDQTQKSIAIGVLTRRSVLVFALLWLMPDGTAVWIGAGFLVVAGLHGAAFIGLRRAVLSGRWITDRLE